MPNDFYKILGIDRNADQRMIDAAATRLRKTYHPDLNEHDPDALRKSQEVNEAYTVLGDNTKREIYDKFGYYSDRLQPAAKSEDASRKPDSPGTGVSILARVSLSADVASIDFGNVKQGSRHVESFSVASKGPAAEYKLDVRSRSIDGDIIASQVRPNDDTTPIHITVELKCPPNRRPGVKAAVVIVAVNEVSLEIPVTYNVIEAPFSTGRTSGSAPSSSSGSAPPANRRATGGSLGGWAAGAAAFALILVLGVIALRHLTSVDHTHEIAPVQQTLIADKHTPPSPLNNARNARVRVRRVSAVMYSYSAGKWGGNYSGVNGDTFQDVNLVFWSGLVSGLGLVRWKGSYQIEDKNLCLSISDLILPNRALLGDFYSDFGVGYGVELEDGTFADHTDGMRRLAS